MDDNSWAMKATQDFSSGRLVMWVYACLAAIGGAGFYKFYNILPEPHHFLGDSLKLVGLIFTFVLAALSTLATFLTLINSNQSNKAGSIVDLYIFWIAIPAVLLVVIISFFVFSPKWDREQLYWLQGMPATGGGFASARCLSKNELQKLKDKWQYDVEESGEEEPYTPFFDRCEKSRKFR